jgi:hypothetical protein
MKMCKFILIQLLLAFPIRTYCQQEISLKEITKAQKKYYRDRIPSSEKWNYSPILELERTLRPQVIAYIKNIDPQFFKGNDSLKMAEGYQQAYTQLFGLVWKSDSDIYRYSFNWTSPITVNIKKVAYSDLGRNSKEIIDYFNNWRSPIFSHIGADMYSGIDDGSYYLGTVYTSLNMVKVDVIAFYH